MSKEEFKLKSDQEKINKAIDLIIRYSGIDGDHHKAWVIDQVSRILLAEKYESMVKDLKDSDYDWYEGIPP